MIILICPKKIDEHSKLKNDSELSERYYEAFIERKELGMIEEVSDGEPGKCELVNQESVIIYLNTR